jgi:hypothetical protein
MRVRIINFDPVLLSRETKHVPYHKLTFNTIHGAVHCTHHDQVTVSPGTIYDIS